MTDSLFNSISVKVFNLVASAASIAGLAWVIAERSSGLQSVSGWSRINVIVHLAILASIAHGILWTIIEKAFRWDYGAGALFLPQGWSAVAISLSLVLPIVIIRQLISQ